MVVHFVVNNRPVSLQSLVGRMWRISSQLSWAPAPANLLRCLNRFRELKPCMVHQALVYIPPNLTQVCCRNLMTLISEWFVETLILRLSFDSNACPCNLKVMCDVFSMLKHSHADLNIHRMCCVHKLTSKRVWTHVVLNYLSIPTRGAYPIRIVS